MWARRFSKRKPGDLFYIVRKGQVRVTKLQGGEEMVLSELGEGEGFGEMALVHSNAKPRTATVKALSEVNLLVLNRGEFTVLTRTLPALAEKMNKLLTERVSLLTAPSFPRKRWASSAPRVPLPWTTPPLSWSMKPTKRPAGVSRWSTARSAASWRARDE